MSATLIHSPALISGLTCPRCNSTKHSKNGKEKGIQRYRCKQCGKNYRNTTGCSIHKIHKKQHIEKYIECLHAGYPLRKAAKETNISLATAFAWRHKLLTKLSQNIKKTFNRSSIIVNHKTPYSEKGRRVKSSHKQKQITSIIQADYSGNIDIHITSTSRPHSFPISRISKQTQYIQNKSLPKTIRNIASTKASDEMKSLAKHYQTELTDWIGKFRGVASKNLHRYWAWYIQTAEFERSTEQKTILTEKCIYA